MKTLDMEYSAEIFDQIYEILEDEPINLKTIIKSWN